MIERWSRANFSFESMFPNFPPCIKPWGLPQCGEYFAPKSTKQWWQGRICFWYVYLYVGKAFFSLGLIKNSTAFISFRLCVAALHYNENGQRQQAVTKDGGLQWRLSYPKRNKGEHAVVRPYKTSITYGMYGMIWLTYLLVICYTGKGLIKSKLHVLYLYLLSIYEGDASQ